MTAAHVGQIVLAHHALIEAVPFLVPVLVVTLTLVVLAAQDRRRADEPAEDPDMET